MWDQDEVSNLSQSTHAQIHKSGACPHPVCMCVTLTPTTATALFGQLKLTHVLSNVLTGLWVASCWLNDFFPVFSGCYKSSFGESIWGHHVLFINSETEPDESEQAGKLVVLYWSSLEAYLSTFRSVTWEQGGHELQLLHNTLLS